jgi:hypothetical protein
MKFYLSLKYPELTGTTAVGPLLRQRQENLTIFKFTLLVKY